MPFDLPLSVICTLEKEPSEDILSREDVPSRVSIADPQTTASSTKISLSTSVRRPDPISVQVTPSIENPCTMLSRLISEPYLPTLFPTPTPTPAVPRMHRQRAFTLSPSTQEALRNERKGSFLTLKDARKLSQPLMTSTGLLPQIPLCPSHTGRLSSKPNLHSFERTEPTEFFSEDISVKLK